MNRLVGRLARQLGLGMGLLAGSMAIALPGYSGSVPVGLGSGVFVGGSTLLPIGASTLGSEEEIASNSPNVVVDPATGEIILTAGAQQTLNTAALQILLGLQTTNPSLAAILSTPGDIVLNILSPVGATGEEGEAGGTVSEIAAAVVAAILNGESVTLISSQGSLSIAAPTVATGAQSGVLVASLQGFVAQTAPAPGTRVATSSVFVPQAGTPLVTPLQGSLEQVANAAGFLAAAFAAGIPPNQVTAFTDMAVAGIDYIDLVNLFNAVSGLLPAQAGGTAAPINATQLEAAIQAYNNILDNTDPDVLVSLAQFEDFVVLGRSLQQLRTAIEVQTSSN
ncbi:hypothetical protein [Leptolyngbya sp. KIOST-1]|uniref:hypothetical protein n=1 Tax=Leptolyngbya sp. KIOST-1 TaxID=1229172 RepID=UPI0012E05984|nr:hypothetical protein [Leptolyngbya sp. KIOST-1]